MRILSRATAIALALMMFFSVLPGCVAEQAPAPNVLTEAAILIDADTGKVLYAKNPDAAMYPASTTKIMTCLLAIENGGLYDTIVIPQEAANVPKDSSLVPVTVGEEMPMIDLLYGFMLHSGNDAGNAVAALVAGSVEAFVSRMNQKAAELGMTGTHFSNPHGYHADDHYTTARDLAILTREAMKSETFREIVGTPGYIIAPSNKRDTNLKIVNSNLMLLSSSEFYSEDVVGVKTGFTNAAGQTFVLAAKRGGARLIGVLLKSGAKSDAPERWQDAKTLMEYGFGRYTSYSFQELYAMSPASVTVINAAQDDPLAGELELSAANLTGAFSAACVDGDASALVESFRANRQYAISADLTAPIASGTIIGTLTYASDDGQSVTATLVASRDVEAEPEPLGIEDVFPFLEGVDWDAAARVAKVGAVVLALLLILRTILRIRRNIRRRRARKRRPNAYRRNSYYE